MALGERVSNLPTLQVCGEVVMEIERSKMKKGRNGEKKRLNCEKDRDISAW